MIFGQVLQAGAGQNPARQVIFKAGLAKTVTADTVNKVCASGLLAVVNAMRSINARRQRRRRRRRNGVDVERALSVARRALRLPLRRRRAGRRDDLRRSVGPVFSDDDGGAGEQGRRRAGFDARRAGSRSRSRAISARPRRTRPAILPTRSCRCKVATKAKGKVVVDAAAAAGRASRVPVAAGVARAASGITNRRRSSRSTTRSTRRS